MITKLRENGLKTGTAFVFQLDLTSLHSVRTFAHEVSQQYHHVHFLINNGNLA